MIPRGQFSMVQNRRAKHVQQRHELGYRIEDIESELEQDLSEFEAVVLRQRLADLKDRLRRIGGPIKEAEEYGRVY